MNKTFDKYRDDPRNEPDEIGVEGTGNLLGEMSIDLDDIGALVFSELVQSPTLGKITRDGFVDAAMETNADSVSKLRNVVLQRRSQVSAMVVDRDMSAD
jgi:DCN1-like protein 1/2